MAEKVEDLFAYHAGRLLQVLAVNDSAARFECWDEIQAFKEWLEDDGYANDLFVEQAEELVGLAQIAVWVLDPEMCSMHITDEPWLFAEYGEGYIPDWGAAVGNILNKVNG